MVKKLLSKIVNDEDLKDTCVNMAALWLAGKVANTISNAVFHFDLNKYNSIDHLVMGIGMGTWAYRKAGRGVLGIATGLVAATLFNVSWENFENRYVWKADNWLTSADTLTDIASVYAGSILGFLSDKARGHVNKDKVKKEDKWLL